MRNQRIRKTEVHLLLQSYCLEKNYALSQLEKLTFGRVSSFAYYAIPSKVRPDGLMNDIETQPTPILLAIKNGDSFDIRETEYTRPYFAGKLEHLFARN
jgi:hypothetical protein